MVILAAVSSKREKEDKEDACGLGDIIRRGVDYQTCSLWVGELYSQEKPGPSAAYMFPLKSVVGNLSAVGTTVCISSRVLRLAAV